MNCINSSVEGVYPFIPSHILPRASQEAGEVGSKIVISMISLSGLGYGVVFDSTDWSGALRPFENVFAAIDEDLDIGLLLVDVDENSALVS